MSIRLLSIGAILSVVVGGTLISTARAAEDKPVEKPTHRVVAIYFHRTKQCPTCKKITAYIKEAVKAEFEEQTKTRQVTMHTIDFQAAKNKKFTKAYKINRPTLVLADIRDGKVTDWKPMPKVWSLVVKKPDFMKYVQKGVRDYLDGKQEEKKEKKQT